MVISQRKYTLDILANIGMLDYKLVNTPERYRQLVGKLNYLTISWSDISFPVSIVSQFLLSPCDKLGMFDECPKTLITYPGFSVFVFSFAFKEPLFCYFANI